MNEKKTYTEQLKELYDKCRLATFTNSEYWLYVCIILFCVWYLKAA